MSHQWTPGGLAMFPSAVTASAVTILLGLMGIATTCTASESDSTHGLGGAERLAAGGDATPADVFEGSVRLTELNLDDATLVMPGRTDGDLVIQLEPSSGGSGLITANLDGAVSRYVSTPLDTFWGHTAADLNAVGDVASAGNLVKDETSLVVGDVFLSEPATNSTPFWVGSVELSDDGSVLIGGLDESRIARVDADGTTQQLLGRVGSDARVVTDQDLGPIVALVALGDDRVAFVAHADGDDERLYLLDHGEVRPVPAEDGSPSPVAGTDDRPEPTWTERTNQFAMTPLAPSPDGRVLTTGLGPEGDPQIALVDVDTGEIEVLAVLEGVEPTIDEPVSAAIVDDDLVFLARHQLWRIRDVIDDPHA